jgi:hypothetical protein
MSEHDSSCPSAILTNVPPSAGRPHYKQAGSGGGLDRCLSVAVISGGDALNPRVIRATTPSTSHDTPRNGVAVQPAEQVRADDGPDHRDHHVGHRAQLPPGPALAHIVEHHRGVHQREGVKAPKLMNDVDVATSRKIAVRPTMPVMVRFATAVWNFSFSRPKTVLGGTDQRTVVRKAP